MKNKVGPKDQSRIEKPTRSGFLYQIEYCPNPDCISIHTRTLFPELDDSGLDLRIIVKNVGKPGWGIKGKIHPFYKDLAKIRGLKAASDTDGYTLFCEKANRLFGWDEIIPKILEAIQTHVAKKQKMIRYGTQYPALTNRRN